MGRVIFVAFLLCLFGACTEEFFQPINLTRDGSISVTVRDSLNQIVHVEKFDGGTYIAEAHFSDAYNINTLKINGWKAKDNQEIIFYFSTITDHTRIPTNRSIKDSVVNISDFVKGNTLTLDQLNSVHHVVFNYKKLFYILQPSLVTLYDIPLNLSLISTFNNNRLKGKLTGDIYRGKIENQRAVITNREEKFSIEVEFELPYHPHSI